MAEITVTLPEIATWTKAGLIEAGVPDRTPYTSVRFLKGSKNIGQTNATSASLIARLLAIKRGGGVSDAKLCKSISGYTSCTMIAVLD
ncbi:hypothetical protein BH10PSE8_BH10PSE8_20240 [soil metagenome]|jgi:hypothetical protein